MMRKEIKNSRSTIHLMTYIMSGTKRERIMVTGFQERGRLMLVGLDGLEVTVKVSL